MTMASTFLLTLCLGMLAMCLAAPTNTIRWCVKSDPELKKCKDLSRTCGTEQASLSCVHKANTDECFKAIADGVADAITLDSGYLYTGSMLPYSLRPIMAENYGPGKDMDTCYYAVALVSKSSSFMFSELKGKRSCHTAVWRSAGWTVPIGYLLNAGQIEWEGPEDQSIERAVTKFFRASCAPGAKEEKLCKQCAGQGNDKRCKKSEAEPYYGYSGAQRCLKEGKGDVAFVNHLIPEEMRKDHELLCTDNTRKPIEEYEKCNWGRIPAHAVVSIQDDSKIQAITEFLKEAQTKQDCKLFSSSHGNDLMFKNSAKSLIPLPAKMDAFFYLGKELYGSMKALHKEKEEPSEEKIRWCTQTKEEKSKCDTWSVSSAGAIDCVEASLAEECITKIAKGEADAATFDGGYLYTAGACGLVPAMEEIYDATECRGTGATPGSYFAVAVVKASDHDISWKNLKGKTSCHTAVGRTAGWNIPLGIIHKETETCDLSTFFKESCAPGADVNSNLCKLCAGDPQKPLDDSKCAANNKELYYGYHGAFRCLIEKGNVAFVKHSTGLEVIKDNPTWLQNMKEEDFRLLCRDGTTRPLNDFKNCYLAQVPSHSVATTPSRKAVVVKILNEQQMKFGKKNDQSEFSMFKSSGRRDQLFKDSTECLREIKVASMNDFLGKEYSEVLSSLKSCTQSELQAACTFHTCRI